MKIGILTFHWATNYGAVLQAYALQYYLISIGHEVDIIDYKPKQYDDTIYAFIRYRKFLGLKNYRNQKRKEGRLSEFRKKYLKLSNRFWTQKALNSAIGQYEVLITGSDQIMNPSFLRYGEKGKKSSVYFLDFKGDFIKIAYAASFGCTSYPTELLNDLTGYFEDFKAISVRENSGKEIVSAAKYIGSQLVPDPTLLLKSSDYLQFIVPSEDRKLFVYMLHGKVQKILPILNSDYAVTFSNDESIEEWLSSIYHAECVITNSFHCVVFCLLFHKPFRVVLDSLENVGMNDRFYSLLSRCNLTNRMQTFESMNLRDEALNINWSRTDELISEFSNIGKDFILTNLK